MIFRLKTIFRNFVNSVIDDEESDILNKELKERVRKIKENNYKDIVIDKLIPYYQDQFQLNENEAWGAAHALYLQGVESGKIDCLNALNYNWKGNVNEEE